MTLLAIVAMQAVWFAAVIGGGLGGALYIAGVVALAALLPLLLWDVSSFPGGAAWAGAIFLYGTILAFGLMALPEPAHRAGGVLEAAAVLALEWTPAAMLTVAWGLAGARMVLPREKGPR